MTALYGYAMSPLDFGWGMLSTVQQHMKNIIDENGHDLGATCRAIAEFHAFTERALEIGSKIGWEGDYRSGGEPHVIILPDDCSPLLALVWKQDNNGSTFVVSQALMPWLGEPNFAQPAIRKPG